MNHTPAIDLRHISKSFEGNTVLEDISLEIPAGKFVMLVGKNGVGKSTLMRIIARREVASSGEGRVFGRPLEEDVSGDAKSIAFVSEAFEVKLPFSLREIVKHIAAAYKTWDQALFDKVVSDLGLSLDQKFDTLSRGQRMHIATAVALARRPKLFLLDEVTAVLDGQSRTCILDYLGDAVDAGATVVMSTNIVTDVADHADLLARIENGKVSVEEK